jgi:hypothetical protein
VYNVCWIWGFREAKSAWCFLWGSFVYNICWIRGFREAKLAWISQSVKPQDARQTTGFQWQGK